MMNAFTFFVGADNYIYKSDSAYKCGKQTAFVAYENHVQRAKEMKTVQHFEDWGGEHSRPYFLALKAFMCMGFDADYDYQVDDDLNVKLIKRETGH